MEPARKDLPIDEVPEPALTPVTPEEESPDSPYRVLQLVEKREHSLLSLIELSKELSVSLDFYAIADLALFNLMGQLCTTKAAIWIVPRDISRSPVLLRSHGIRKQWARAIGTTCGTNLAAHFQEGEQPTLVSDLNDVLGEGGKKISNLAGIALFVPIHARGKLFALIGLGERVDRKPFDRVELQVLQASLGMIGVALENTGLYNRLLEKHRQLRMANQTLQELDRLKSEFLRNVNHELRTPLTIIIAYTNFLQDQERDEQRKEFLDTVAQESEKLRVLVEKLLDFSAVTGEGLEINVETGDIEELVQAFHRDRLPGVAETLHEFTVEVKDRIPLVRFDPHRVRQILDILVDNAVKFTPPGSKIQIVMETVNRDGQVWVQIDVADDGPGIAENRLEDLFDSFRQGDGSPTRTVGGMGMGLAHARNLAENMGGRLEVTSTPGSGSKFSLLLPTA